MFGFGKKKPNRLTISLDDETYAMITKLSEDLGVSKSEVITEVFNQMAPAMMQISAAFRMVKNGFSQVGEEAFSGFLEGMRAEVETSISDATKAWDGMKKRAQGEEKDIRPADTPTPPAANAGSTQESAPGGVKSGGPDPRMVTRELHRPKPLELLPWKIEDLEG